MDGTFMDSTGSLLKAMMELKPLPGYYSMVLVFMTFVLLSAMTVMNMLIGVLCQVVSEVADKEKEDAAIRLLKETLLKMLLLLDEDGSGDISYEELNAAFDNPQATQ